MQIVPSYLRETIDPKNFVEFCVTIPKYNEFLAHLAPLAILKDIPVTTKYTIKQKQVIIFNHTENEIDFSYNFELYVSGECIGVRFDEDNYLLATYQLPYNLNIICLETLSSYKFPRMILFKENDHYDCDYNFTNGWKHWGKSCNSILEMRGHEVKDKENHLLNDPIWNDLKQRLPSNIKPNSNYSLKNFYDKHTLKCLTILNFTSHSICCNADSTTTFSIKHDRVRLGEGITHLIAYQILGDHEHIWFESYNSNSQKKFSRMACGRSEIFKTRKWEYMQSKRAKKAFIESMENFSKIREIYLVLLSGVCKKGEFKKEWQQKIWNLVEPLFCAPSNLEVYGVSVDVVNLIIRKLLFY